MMPTNPPPDAAHDLASRHTLRQTIAIGMCGAIGGASVFQAFASLWLHPAVSVTQPTAEPLAIAGAILGLATAVVVHRRARRRSLFVSSSFPAGLESPLLDDSALGAPMAWQPAPVSIPREGAGEFPASSNRDRSSGPRWRAVRAQPHVPSSRWQRARPPRRFPTRG